MTPTLTMRWPWVVPAVVACVLMFGEGFVRAQTTTDALAVQIEAAHSEYRQLVTEFEAARGQFEAYLVEVDALKGEREEASAMASDDDLRTALREAREMALALQGRSETLRQLADDISALESGLLTEVEARLAELEEDLRQAPTGYRAEILAEIVELSDLRERYLRPLEAVPEVPLDSILVGLDEAVTPEELLATADELSDNERRLLEHLTEIEDRIQTLESQLELRARDRLFRRESALFEEGVNTGRAASARAAETDSTGSTGSQGDTAGAGASADGDSDGAPSANPDARTSDEVEDPGGGGLAPPPGESPTEGPTDAQDSEGDDIVPTMGVDDSYGGFNGEPTSGDLDDGSANRTDEPDPIHEPTLEPELPGPDLNGVTAPQGDPTILWTTGDRIDEEELGVRGRLDRLRRERDQARETLEELRQRRQQILERVQELEELETF